MYKKLQYGDEAGEIIQATREDGSVVVIEADAGELWALASGGSLGKVAKYKAPPAPSKAAILKAERAGMSCGTAQMALHLIDMDAGDTEAAIMANPRAAAIWTKAAKVRRAGPFLEALKTVHTDEEIDDMFRQAAQIEV